MSTTSTTLDLTVESTPDITELSTVPSLPFDLQTEDFEDSESSYRITEDVADAILCEIWRLSRNPRLLEIERETRGHMVPRLQLETFAVEHSHGGTLNATAAARAFIETVRDEYTDELVSGPTSTWADTAAPSELRTLQVE